MSIFQQTDRRILKSKQALKDALLQCLMKKELNDITIIEIVRIANVNRGTFYKNYETKQSIFDDILKDVYEDLTLAFRYPYQKNDILAIKNLSPKDVKLFEHVDNYRNFYNLIFLNASFYPYQKQILKFIKQIQLEELETLHYTNKLDLELLTIYRAHAIFGMIGEWVESGYTYSASYLAEQYVKFIHISQISEKYKVQKINQNILFPVNTDSTQI